MAEPEKKPDSPPAAPATAAKTATPAGSAPGAATAAPAKKPEPPKPTFQIYNRQKDQHVVGPGCWCLPKIEVVDGRKVIIHKRD